MANYTHILFTRVDEQTKQQIAQAAADLSMSEANFVRDAIAQALAEYREYINPTPRAVTEAQALAQIEAAGERIKMVRDSASAHGIELQ